MKKLLLIILALSLCLVPLTGCSNNLGSAKLSGTQKTDYVVHNNGSSAVRYGNYLYFVNGYRGFDDTEGNDNVFGKVTKGGLYRVELSGENNGGEYDLKENILGNSFATGLYFKDYVPYVSDSNNDKRYFENADFSKFEELVNAGSTDLEVEKFVKDDEGKDTEEKETVTETFAFDDVKYEVRGVERLSGKTIGTSGYAKGGIYIFDDFVYYASPNNERNKTGTVQTSLTDFFATKLDGSATYKLYTTASNTSSSPYGFYKYGDSVYLTVLDGRDLISVRTQDGKKKEVNKIAEDISSAVMPVNKTYDAKNHNENTVDEYIFTSRSATDEDKEILAEGTIIEYMRPDGSDRNVFLAESKTCSIEAVSDGLVYYRITDAADTTSLRYSDVPAITKKSQGLDGTIVSDVSSYTSFYIYNSLAAYDDKSGQKVPNENEIFVIGKTSNGLYVINGGERIKISNTSGDVFGVYENYVYFKNSTNIIRCNIATPAGEETDEQIVSNIGTSGLNPTVFDGMLVYFGQIDTSLTNYTHIYFTQTNANQFVGELAPSDITTTDDTTAEA